MGNLFFGSPSGRSSSFFGPPQRRTRREKTPLDQLEEREANAAALLEASGSIPEPKPSVLERATDILMRPAYAAAGAVEELVTTQDMREALSRAGREFYSGIGGLQGEKQGFGEVLGDLGVPEYGHLSALLPFLYNETGKGWRPRAGGPWDPTGRGAIGFALEVPLDPLTYLSFGAGHTGTSLVRVGGRIAAKQRFSRAGLRAVGDAFEHELPDATKLATRILKGMRAKVPAQASDEILSLPPLARRSTSRVRLEGEMAIAQDALENVNKRLAKKPLDPFLMAEQQQAASRVGALSERLNRRAVVEEFAGSRTFRSGLNGVTDDEALLFARERDMLANEVAHQNAVTRIHDAIRGGMDKYADTSVVRFMGQPLLKREQFKAIGAPVSRMLRHVNELPYGAQILSGMRKISEKGKPITSGIDRMFNETLRAARKIPGALEARTLFRAESRNFRRANAESVGKLVKGLRKVKLIEPVTFAGRQVTNAAEYVGLHLDDPVRFPKEALPAQVIDRLPAIRAMTGEWFANEVRAGIMDPKAYREHYFTHIFDNTDDQINRLSTSWASKKGVPFDKTFMRGPWGESRVFPSLTDAMEWAQKLKAEGVIDFDLKPILDVGEVLAKRGDSHALSMAAERYYTRAINNFGLSPEQVDTELFKRTFPELAEKLNQHIAAGTAATFGEGQALDAIFPNGQVTALTVGQLLRRAQEGAPLPKLPRATRRRAVAELGGGLDAPRRAPEGYAGYDAPTVGGAPDAPPRVDPEGYGAYGEQVSPPSPYVSPTPFPNPPVSPVGYEAIPGKRARPKAAKLSAGLEAPERIPVGYEGLGMGGRPTRAKVKPGGYSPEVQALYWMGRLQSATSMKDLARLMKKGEEHIAHLDPKLVEQIRGVIGTSRRRYLAEFNEPYAKVKGGPYSGMYMPQAMAEEADRIGTTIVNRREVNGLLKKWDLLQDVFKTNVTSIFPAFHIRNAMSNVATTFTDIGMAAFNPGRMARVAGIMLGKDGTVISDAGRRYTNNEVRQLFTQYGLGTPGTALIDSAVRVGRQPALVEHGITGTARLGRKVGQKVEDHAKLINFVTWLERGLDPASAAQRVHATLFDYDQLAPFERDVLRRIFPFYTWTSKNLRLAAEQIAKHPGRVQAQLELADSDRGPEREMLPNYLRGDFKIKLEDEGKLTYVTGLDLPITSAIETAFGGSGRSALTQNLASVTPALKAIIELGFKRDLWTGRSLEERQALGDFMGGVVEKMPKATQEWLEYQKGVGLDGEEAYSINGLKAHLLFKSYFLSRAFSTATKIPSPESDDMKSFLVDFFTNVDVREFDLSEQQEKRLRNRVREMEAELVRRGVMRTGRPYLPKASQYAEPPKSAKRERKNLFL